MNDIDNLRFGWTGFTTSIHWMVPTVAGGMVGFGIITIFMQCFNYLLDTYLQLYFPLSFILAYQLLTTLAPLPPSPPTP